MKENMRPNKIKRSKVKIKTEIKVVAAAPENKILKSGYKSKTAKEIFSRR